MPSYVPTTTPRTNAFWRFQPVYSIASTLFSKVQKVLTVHGRHWSPSIPLRSIGGPVKSHSGYNPRVWTASTPPPAKIPSKRCWLHASGMLGAVKPLSIPTSTKATQGNWWTCVPKCLCQHNVMNWEWTSHQTPRTSCRVSWLSKTPQTRPAGFACSSPPSTLP